MNADVLNSAAVVISAVAGLVSAVGIFIVRTRIKEVHVMVNSQREVMEARIEELSNTLRSADVTVPVAHVKEK